MRSCPGESKNILILFFFATCLVISLLLANIRQLHHNCFNITDFGILQEAIVRLPQEFNPLLKVRGLKAYNDHFDPITWALSPGLALSNFNPQFLILAEWSAWAFIAFFLAWRSSLILALLWILGRPFLEALLYPIHPNTWAMVPLFFVGRSLPHFSAKPLIFLALITPLFREIYPFCFLSLGLGLYFFEKKHRNLALSLFAISLSWLVLIFIIRPMVSGPGMNYAGQIIQMLTQNPIESIFYILAIQKPPAIFKLFFPILMMFTLSFYRLKKNHPAENQLFKISIKSYLFFLAPYALAHFIFGQFMHHYGVPFLALGLGVLSSISSLTYSRRDKLILLLTFLVFSSSPFTKVFKNLFSSKTKYCEMTKAHSLSTERVLSHFKKINKEANVLASGGIIPQLIGDGRNIFHVYSWIPHLASYDYILYERNNTGAHHPLNDLEIETILNQCRPHAQEIIFEDRYYLFMKGPFPGECAQLEGKNHGKP